jgi:hypothetical protein
MRWVGGGAPPPTSIGAATGMALPHLPQKRAFGLVRAAPQWGHWVDNRLPPELGVDAEDYSLSTLEHNNVLL